MTTTRTTADQRAGHAVLRGQKRCSLAWRTLRSRQGGPGVKRNRHAVSARSVEMTSDVARRLRYSVTSNARPGRARAGMRLWVHGAGCGHALHVPQCGHRRQHRNHGPSTATSTRPTGAAHASIRRRQDRRQVTLRHRSDTRREPETPDRSNEAQRRQPTPRGNPAARRQTPIKCRVRAAIPPLAPRRGGGTTLPACFPTKDRPHEHVREQEKNRAGRLRGARVRRVARRRRPGARAAEDQGRGDLHGAGRAAVGVAHPQGAERRQGARRDRVHVLGERQPTPTTSA